MRKPLIGILAAVLAFCIVDGFWAKGQEPATPAGGKGTLEVVVVGEAGQPLPGARVSLPGHRVSADRTGSCKTALLPGRYPVLINKDGYRGQRISAGVRPGETTTLRVQLQKLAPARPPGK